MVFARKYLKKILKIIEKPEMKILPGHLAFFLVLSIIPIITLVGYVTSLFHVSIDSVVNLVKDVIPYSVFQVLVPFINGNGMDFNIGFSMITGYIVASNGAHSIIVSCNTLYGIEHANYLSRRIKALFLTILLVALFVFTLFGLAFGNSILKFILSFPIFDLFGDKIYYLFLLFKWPIAIVFMFVMLKLIYTIAPDSDIPSRFTTRGALFTTFSWIVITFIYSYYVMNFSNYDIFYGSLSNIIVMMMWIYILAYAFVIGIAINVNDYKVELRNNNRNKENNI